jgi:transcription initiation factor TFIID TATA-box-binding protein
MKKNKMRTCQNKPQLAVKNMVCSYNLGSPCNLTRIMIELMDSENIEYEPEVFPGLVCRITDPKVVFLLSHRERPLLPGERIWRM